MNQAGFTLVEMLVIAPLVLIVIAGLVGVMVSMVGDTLLATGRVSTAYNIQDALGQIEQDTRVATGFMGTFSYFNSPQGRDGNTAPFSYSSNGDLILTQQATTTSPYNTARSLLYYDNQPATCGATMDGNRALVDRIVYFLVNNSNGTKSLWRRTIVNPWDGNTSSPDGNTVCGTPWQRDSCPQGSTISNTPSSTCQSVDQKMLDNVTAFTPTFYDASGNTVTDPTQAYSVSVSVTVQQNISGSTVTQTSAMRAARRNDVPATPVPSAPTISIYNPGINSYNNPILTSFQWSAPGAYTYLVSTQVGGGAWSTPQSTAATNISVSSPANTTVSIQVTAVNDSGNSTTTTYSTTSDLFTTMNLAGNWSCFSTDWPCPAFTRTSAGVVVLRGLVTGGSGTIATLPPGFRPDKQLMFPVMSTGASFARVDVFPDGTVMWQAGGNNSWIDIDLTFMSSDYDTSLTWTNPTFYCPSGCTTAWTNYLGGTTSYGKLQVTKDNLGRGQYYGLMSVPAPYPPPNYSSMTSVPAGYQPSAADIYPDISSSNVYASFEMSSTATVFRTNLGGGWKSIGALYYPNNGSASWQNASLQNSWVNYGGAYASAQYTKASDGLVTLHGLVKGGTTTYGTTVFTLPSGYRPSGRLIFMTSGYNGTTEVPVRMDILPTGEVIIESNTGTITNSYLSLAGITFYQDGT